tara:strand:- start:701 stop:1171 length:471 start_codon:yes stop_codon:yes gene_type:complete
MNEQIQLEDVENLSNKEVPRTYIACNDERLNYTFCKKEDIDKVNTLPDLIGREMFDYGVVIKKGEPETENNVGTLDEVAPISYATINNPVEGEEWYRHKFPNLPEEFYGIIARYTWGDKFTKKSLKNEIKKAKKKPKRPLPQGLTMMKGSFTLSFD